MSYQTNAHDPKHHAPYAGHQAHQYNENMDSNLAGAINQFQNLSLGHGMMAPGSQGMGPVGGNPNYLVPQAQEGPFVLTPVGAMGMEPLSVAAPYSTNPYLGAHGQMPPYLPYSMMPFTPGRGLHPQDRASRLGHAEAPGLENRRGSYSTTESTPATPFFNGMAKHDQVPRVAVHDRSAYTTPSPQQLGNLQALQDVTNKHNVINIPVDRNLEEMLQKSPAIPKAVPAVFTPASQMKTLDQSLENRIPGNRNVYIRGLHPTTDDELLFRFASRFGDVETSKAIIDTSTGACKGFGFAKFFDGRDSEMCIRGFHRLGYEVGFARESFNSRLKAEGDEGSTNLYISNLPKSLTEVELGAVFSGFTILSSKILRDSMGNSRGVGFARFENRDVCDEIIKRYNGIGVGEECLQMNIRYADTPSQKELKRVTAERRQFRTNEYNIGAYGTPLVGIQPHMYQNAWKRSVPRESSSDVPASSTTPEESDEGVTIHADATTIPTSTQSSPAAKRDHK